MPQAGPEAQPWHRAGDPLRLMASGVGGDEARPLACVQEQQEVLEEELVVGDRQNCITFLIFPLSSGVHWGQSFPSVHP